MDQQRLPTRSPATSAPSTVSTRGAHGLFGGVTFAAVGVLLLRLGPDAQTVARIALAVGLLAIATAGLDMMHGTLGQSRRTPPSR